jgi:carbon starvation protein
MGLLALLGLSLVLFSGAYWLYGGFIARRLGVDDKRPTPAHTRNDGVDFVPTPTPVLFGHHFSSIAGAGPIVGPIIAGLAFGWAPALMWIVFGSIFFGGAHDFTALFASLRNGGRTIAEICRDSLGRTAHIILLLFILFTLIYVIIVFLDLTAVSFAPPVPRSALEAQALETAARAAENGSSSVAVESARAAAAALEEGRAELQRGGAVATASLLYIVLAVMFGWLIHRRRLTLRAATWIFVPLVFLGLWIGQAIPLTADRMPVFLGSAKNFWALVLLGYCAFASVLPVWLLLQPRDYLSSFLLYGCLAGGLVGVIATALGGGGTIAYPAFLGWKDAGPSGLGFLFPALFVTIACGAISGFHSMVASGTTARQANTESAARLVGYGGMLVEGVLALLALATVMTLTQRPSTPPAAVFADGMGRFLSAMGLPMTTAHTFGLLAVSTFLLTTLDTCTRLCRFVVEELFGVGGSMWSRLWTTFLVLALPAATAFRTIGGQPIWQAVWPAFGASNQLMAALALLVVYGWLKRQGRPAGYVLVPMVFMFVTTVTALGQLAWFHLYAIPDPAKRSLLVGGLSLFLAALALFVAASAIVTLSREIRKPPQPAEV